VSDGKVKEVLKRDLAEYDLVALLTDGKGFADEGVIVAPEVIVGGDKIILGFAWAATENERVVEEFLSTQIERG
jgi:hypothetical protein